MLLLLNRGCEKMKLLGKIALGTLVATSLYSMSTTVYYYNKSQELEKIPKLRNVLTLDQNIRNLESEIINIIPNLYVNKTNFNIFNQSNPQSFKDLGERVEDYHSKSEKHREYVDEKFSQYTKLKKQYSRINKIDITNLENEYYTCNAKYLGNLILGTLSSVILLSLGAGYLQEKHWEKKRIEKEKN